MLETPQQYTLRILGYVEGKDPVEILAASPRQIARLVKGISRKKLLERPASNKWSVTEILAHLADSEIVYGFRIRLILEAGGPPIQGIDQDAWARFSDYAKHDPVPLPRILPHQPQEARALVEKPAPGELGSARDALRARKGDCYAGCGNAGGT